MLRLQLGPSMAPRSKVNFGSCLSEDDRAIMANMEELLEQWVAARDRKDYATADGLRAELRALGVDAFKSQQSLAGGGALVPTVPPPHFPRTRLCKKWARGQACEEATCSFRHEFLDPNEESAAKRARLQRSAALSLAEDNDDDVAAGAKLAHASRHLEFVQFVRKTFGKNRALYSLPAAAAAAAAPRALPCDDPCDDPCEDEAGAKEKLQPRATGRPGATRLAAGAASARVRVAPDSERAERGLRHKRTGSTRGAATLLPAEVRVQVVHDYDESEYPFTDFVCEALGVEPAELARLHKTPAGVYCQQHATRSGHDPFRRRWLSFIDRSLNPEARRRLDELVARFVAKRLRAATGDRWKHFVYQAEPSMRVHLAGTRSLGIRHCDADYYHQPNEINFWIPLVERVWGANSLQCESSPGAGDFAPFEASRGQFVQFYGNQVVHYNVANTTDVTRVSLDLRVVPLPLFAPEWASPKGTVPFRLGQYYSSTSSRGGASVVSVHVSVTLTIAPSAPVVTVRLAVRL